MSKLIRVIFAGIALMASLALGAQVHAQATDLDCNKCVDRSEILEQAISSSKIKGGAVIRSKIRDDAVNDAKLSVNLRNRIMDIEADQSRPRWRVKHQDPVTRALSDVAGIEVDLVRPNRAFGQNLKIVQVKLTDDNPIGANWYPAVIGQGDIMAFGYQGTELNHAILAFDPNTNCSGDPVKFIFKKAVGSLLIPQSGGSVRWWVAYDYRNGNVYDFDFDGSAGVVSSDVSYDLLEYGQDLGFFPADGCSVNVNLLTRSDLNSSGVSLITDLVLVGNSAPDAGKDLILVYQ